MSGVSAVTLALLIAALLSPRAYASNVPSPPNSPPGPTPPPFKLAPDLIVAGISPTATVFASTDAATQQTICGISAWATVKNLGGAAPASDLKVQISGLPGWNYPAGVYFSTLPLAQGQSQDVGLGFTVPPPPAPPSAGPCTILNGAQILLTVTVDPISMVAESNEQNNVNVASVVLHSIW